MGNPDHRPEYHFHHSISFETWTLSYRNTCSPSDARAVGRAMQRGRMFGGRVAWGSQSPGRCGRWRPARRRSTMTAPGPRACRPLFVWLGHVPAETGSSNLRDIDHGRMDSGLYGASPPLEQMGPPDSPDAVPMSVGQSQGTALETIVPPWNDLEILEEAVIRRYGVHIRWISTRPLTEVTTMV